MQQACLLIGPTSTIDARCWFMISRPCPWPWALPYGYQSRCSATLSKNHYAVFGIPPSASSADIKRAYRLLALKFHPDVSKDSQADEVFKSILAYNTLSNEISRKQYDRALKLQEDTGNEY